MTLLRSSVIGRRYQQDAHGRLLAQAIDPTVHPYTYADGKREYVERFLRPPLVVAGDSRGDVALITMSDRTRLCMIVNNGQTGAIAQFYRPETLPPSVRRRGGYHVVQHVCRDSGRFIPRPRCDEWPHRLGSAVAGLMAECVARAPTRQRNS